MFAVSNASNHSAPPTLATFPQRASWLNRASRIDRSACVELKASDLWRSIAERHWQRKTRKVQGKSHLIAQTTTSVTAHQLQSRHDEKPSFTLQGDLRTEKSNALKHAGLSPSGANPNKGQSRTKRLGLPTDWSQELTLQSWRMHARLIQHFFACPQCDQRALKLFLPLCTEEELRDALTAQRWLNNNQKRIATSSTLRPQASKLIARYAVLFEPRSLHCRKCLGLRYGESHK